MQVMMQQAVMATSSSMRPCCSATDSRGALPHGEQPATGFFGGSFAVGCPAEGLAIGQLRQRPAGYSASDADAQTQQPHVSSILLRILTMFPVAVLPCKYRGWRLPKGSKASPARWRVVQPPHSSSGSSSSAGHSASPKAETCAAASRNLETAQAICALSRSPASSSASRSSAASCHGPTSTGTKRRPCRRRSR